MYIVIRPYENREMYTVLNVWLKTTYIFSGCRQCIVQVTSFIYIICCRCYRQRSRRNNVPSTSNSKVLFYFFKMFANEKILKFYTFIPIYIIIIIIPTTLLCLNEICLHGPYKSLVYFYRIIQTCMTFPKKPRSLYVYGIYVYPKIYV